MKDVITVKTVQCKRCGYTWLPRKPDVFRCPSCQSIHWNSPKPKTEVRRDA